MVLLEHCLEASGSGKGECHVLGARASLSLGSIHAHKVHLNTGVCQLQASQYMHPVVHSVPTFHANR
eukprot:1160528-Pelagomonas_calceolata.AAC.4